jgi:1-acyl-sn-glycerol-3-phosphate acyltransferase
MSRPRGSEHPTEPCGAVPRLLGRGFLRLLGWQVEGELPPYPRLLVLGAPHTSNWDLLVVVASAWSLGVRMRFLAKSQLFGPATGWLFRALGGIPVERSSPQGLVQQLVDVFAVTERMALLIPPEGTRGRREAWKSGFYHVALAADVPVVASYADYRRHAALPRADDADPPRRRRRGRGRDAALSPRASSGSYSSVRDANTRSSRFGSRRSWSVRPRWT